MAETVKDPQATLRQEIIADARRQAERLLRRARQEAETFAAQAEQEATDHRDQALKQARQTAARQTALILARIPVARARLRAAHIERLLASVRAAAAARLAPTEHPLSREALLALIAEPVGAMAGETFAVRLSQADRLTLTDTFADEIRRRTGKPGLELRLAEEPLPDTETGPVLSDPAGRQIWDNRLPARLARLWPGLRRQVAAATGLDAVDKEPETHP